ncbi:hypothetical protein N7462_004149 [Penicillium macrosclerotiorum]|uniref:uncharacterized protein n=1 Tax=Penicillium macrosclerotiorum TaxID=303699 RepID=UPI00254887BC|nr:uncharacterized protein N7462_004149 [Penicillium macrosclerotiorum]KAJ5689757.1 hypothetical protein N7462_004149 [Penicillium macrosclerotiorum]
MSSFLASLLTEFGFRPRLPRSTQPSGHAESHPSEQTISPAIDEESVTNKTGEDCGAFNSTGGNAGSLDCPHFYTTLTKEMDGRNPELEGARPSPQNGHFPNQPFPIAINHSVGINTTASVNALPVNTEVLRSQDSPTTNQRQEEIPGALLSWNHNGTGPQSNPAVVDELGQISLPEDDGMGWLRKKIHAIRNLDLNNNEKARMVHDLMTESYNSSRRALSSKSPLPVSPISNSQFLNQSNNSPATQETSPSSGSSPTSPTLTTLNPQHEDQFSLTLEDLQPTYASRPEPESPVIETVDEDADTEECEEALLGCPHYKRNVKLQCFTCKKWYTCRFCHDKAEDHHLIRRDTENMLCMLCGHAQPAAQLCRQCDTQTAQYYCDICKLWDNDSKKSIYHCHDCGICRIGQGLGKDFFHCKTCCVCLPISIEDTHRCIERSTQCDCPICGDYMFTSPETVVVMRCGHSIHHKCLSEYSKTSFRCPICSKTITNMESTFRNLDRTIESQPMPVEFKDTKGLIYCNDCGAKSVVKYHWLGLKCDLCESYNTAQLRLLQGDVSDILEEEGVDENQARPRSASLNVNEESMASLATLHLTPNPAPRLSVPTSAESDRRTVSYNMSHGRAISPVVSNYFGLPTERESEKSSSLPFFGSASRVDGDTDYGALNFLSKKLRDRYGFLAGDAKIAEGTSEADEEEEEEEEEDDDDERESSSSSDTDVDKDEEDDEDDGAEYIDIFGHR